MKDENKNKIKRKDYEVKIKLNCDSGSIEPRP
jgi:hypothetical protein